jgi:hypothetical protein
MDFSCISLMANDISVFYWSCVHHHKNVHLDLLKDALKSMKTFTRWLDFVPSHARTAVPGQNP